MPWRRSIAGSRLATRSRSGLALQTRTSKVWSSQLLVAIADLDGVVARMRLTSGLHVASSPYSPPDRSASGLPILARISISPFRDSPYTFSRPPNQDDILARTVVYSRHSRPNAPPRLYADTGPGQRTQPGQL